MYRFLRLFSSFNLYRRPLIALALLASGLMPMPFATAAPGRGTYQAMDYGPVIAETIRVDWPEGNTALKGLAVRLDHGAAMVFDTDLLRWAAATEGGWIDLSRTSHTSYKGSRPASTEGEVVFATSAAPGWARGESFADPRPGGRGNLPKEWGHYRGFHRHNDRVVLTYTAGESTVREFPHAVRTGETTVFTRTLLREGNPSPASVYVTRLPPDSQVDANGTRLLEVINGDEKLVIALAGVEEGASLRVTDDLRVELDLGEISMNRPVRLLMARLRGESAAEAVRSANRALDALPDPFTTYTRGGPNRWEQTFRTEAKLSQDDEAYVVDRIALPEENPWGAWMRLAGLDFFESGGRAAVSTWNGDVWIVSGLDGDLKQVTWRRFASGLFYPMGLAIRDGEIFVLERSQITRLHDLNGNGEADYYENFNNDSFVHPMAHALCLELDSEGNFYFFKNGNRVPGRVPEHGALFRVSRDGSKREIVADGIRGSNSLGIGPDDRIFSSDQQGNWVPTARLDWVRPNRFYGYRPHGGDDYEVGDFEPPVVWIPHRVDNSTGPIVYAGDERWGPLAGNYLVGSYGQATLLLLLKQEVGGRLQGGVVPFPLTFESGLVRGAFNPADGQLYLAGMKGWSTLGPSDGSLDRVRFTGRPNHMPTAFEAHPGGVTLTFSEPLAAEPPPLENFKVERWQYIYSRRYGSPEISVEDPEREGRDPVDVSGVRLSDDRRQLTLEIPEIAPVMVMSVNYRLRFADGGEAANVVYHTIHRLSPEDRETLRVVVGDTEGRVVAEFESVAGEDVGETGDGPPHFALGRELFEVNCRVCHQPPGQAGIAPAMEESSWARADSAALIRILLHGKQGSRGAMMPFGWMDDEDLAAVVSYIREKFADLEKVEAEEVKAVRDSTADRSGMWTEEELRELFPEE